MRENRAKRALSQGGVALGTMVVEFSTTGIARILAAAGADFVIYDMEHTGWTTETIRLLMAASRAADVVPMVRVPATEYHFIANVLDVGAMGVMVPMVETAEQARFVVDSARYTPLGHRGAGFGVAHDDYLGGDVLAKMQSANDELLIIALVETALGVENVESIASVPGIDVLWVGFLDLANSMGISAQFTHPDFVAALERVVRACQKEGKAAGYLVTSPEEGRRMLAQGFRCLAYGGDVHVYREAMRQGLKAMRAAAVAS